jgi:hypothetical protein
MALTGSTVVSDLWTNDLINVGYEDVPAIRETLDVHYPCVGQNALVGVYFYPSVIEAKLRTSALSKVFILTQQGLENNSLHWL